MADESLEEHFIVNDEGGNEQHPVVDCDVDVLLRTDVGHETIDGEVITRTVQASERIVHDDYIDCGEDDDENEELDETLVNYDSSDENCKIVWFFFSFLFCLLAL